MFGEGWIARTLVTKRGSFTSVRPLTHVASAEIREKNLMFVIFRPRFWGWKWLRQFYGRLGFFGSFCWKKPHAHKGGGFLGFLERGGSANFIFMRTGRCFRTEQETPCARSEQLEGYLRDQNPS